MNFITDIEDVVFKLKNAKEEGTNVNLLIGAGCSVTAGIPTAEGFIAEIRRKFPKYYKDAKTKDYGTCMSMLTKKERRNLIMKFVSKSKINWTHLCIAQLIHNGYINRVLTTNFDDLLQRACSLVNEFPGIYDLATSSGFKSELLFEKSILFLHGQYTGFVLCNTESEVNSQKQNLDKVFDELKKDSVWLVVGYSGQNDAILQLLCEEKTFENRLFWVGYNDNKPSKVLMENLLNDGKYAFYINDYDSDSFFIRLTQELECFPPKFIEKPFSYLSDRLNELVKYKLKSEDPFIDEGYVHITTDDIIQKAICEIENDKVKMLDQYLSWGLTNKATQLLIECINGKDNKLRDRVVDKFSKFIDSRMEKAGKYIEQYDKAEFIDNKKIQMNLLEAYEIKYPEGESNESLIKACEKCEIILKHYGEDIDLLNKYASILIKIGDGYHENNEISDAALKYEEALNKYNKIRTIDTLNIENLLNINDLYYKQATLYAGDDKKINIFLKKSLKILQNAYEIDNRNSDILVRWANYLINMALICIKDADKLLNDTNKKYKEAYELDTENITILLLWSKALFRLTRYKLEDNIRIKNFDIGVDKLKIAYNINDNKKIIIEEWISFIIMLLQNKLYNKTYEKYYIEFITFFHESEDDFTSIYRMDVIGRMNSIAYNLIVDNNEFKISKKILDILMQIDISSTFKIATLGLWYFRNDSIKYNEAYEKGCRFYSDSITKANNLKKTIDSQALLQKFLIEKCRFIKNRGKDIDEVKRLSCEAYDMGELEEYEFVYKEAEKLHDEVNKKISEVAICT